MSVGACICVCMMFVSMCGMCNSVCERETETERDRERQRQRDRETERKRERQRILIKGLLMIFRYNHSLGLV